MPSAKRLNIMLAQLDVCLHVSSEREKSERMQSDVRRLQTEDVWQPLERIDYLLAT